MKSGITERNLQYTGPPPSISSPVLESALVAGYHFAMISSWEAPKLLSLDVSGILFDCPRSTITFPAVETLELYHMLPSDNMDEQGVALGNLLSGMGSLRHIIVGTDHVVLRCLFTVLRSFIPAPRVDTNGHEVQAETVCPKLCDITIPCMLKWDDELLETFDQFKFFDWCSSSREDLRVVVQLTEHSGLASIARARASSEGIPGTSCGG